MGRIRCHAWAWPGSRAHWGQVSCALSKQLTRQGSQPPGIPATLNFLFIWISLFDDLLTTFSQYTHREGIYILKHILTKLGVALIMKCGKSQGNREMTLATGQRWLMLVGGLSGTHLSFWSELGNVQKSF